MRALLQWVGVCVGLFGPVAAAQAQFMGVYDYPFVSPLAATVAATPPANQPAAVARARSSSVWPRSATSTSFPARTDPAGVLVFRPGHALCRAQAEPARAPLFFIIGGTGAGHDSAKSYGLANVALPGRLPRRQPAQPDPSELHRHRVVAPACRASSSTTRSDLYRVMGMIADDLAGEIGITDYYVGGYSLGGTHAAFVSELDAQEKRFDFKQAVVINPAVSLYNSVNLLDHMVDNHLRARPGGGRPVHRPPVRAGDRRSTAPRTRSTSATLPSCTAPTRCWSRRSRSSSC